MAKQNDQISVNKQINADKDKQILQLVQDVERLKTETDVLKDREARVRLWVLDSLYTNTHCAGQRC